MQNFTVNYPEEKLFDIVGHSAPYISYSGSNEHLVARNYDRCKLQLGDQIQDFTIGESNLFPLNFLTYR